MKNIFSFIIGSLIDFSSWLAEAVHVLWRYRIIVLALVVFYLAIWQLDQGQDLLVNLNDSHVGVILFYTTITILAFLFWHLPKYFSQNTNANWETLRVALRDVITGTISYEKSAPKDLNIARILGVLAFLLPAFAVLNVLDKYGITVPNPGLYFALTVLFYVVLFHLNWIEDTYERSRTSRKYFHLAIVLALVATSVFGLFNQGRPRDLRWLSAGLCLISVAFSIAVSIRRHLGQAGMAGWFSKKYASRWVMGASVFMAVVFIAMNFFPYAGIGLPSFTISALLCGLVFHVLLFSFLLLWTRVSRVNIAAFFVLVAFLMAVFSQNPFHEVRQIPQDAGPKTLTAHIIRWLGQRNIEISKRDKAHPYPIFIVNAYGGGIRAAAWTSLVVQRLDSAVDQMSDGDNFQHHVLAYSGASGGTIGASIMVGLRCANQQITRGTLKKFYRRDFLSPVLIGLIGRDFFFSTFGSVFSWFGVPMEDRATLQEKSWEKQFENAFGTSYDDEFSALYLEDSICEVPLLLANTTEIKKGLKGIVAPVDLDSLDFHGAILLNKLFKLDHNLRLSTASFLSARFPAISPAGKIDTANYFMDGGLKENSGAETARELRAVLERIVQSDSTLRDRIKIYILSLPNTASSSPEIKRKQIVQLTAPLQAFVTNWEGNTRVADSLNQVLFKGSIFSIRPTNSLLEDEDGKYRAVLPLGWQISGKALERLDQCLNERQKEVEELVRVFKK